MASIHQLNQAPNPIWNFVNGNLEDHPFFAPRGHYRRGRGGPRDSPETAGENEATGEKAETSASDSDSPDNHRHEKCKNKSRGPGHHGPGPFRGKGGKGKHRGPRSGPYDFHGHHHDHYGPGAFGFGGPGHHGMGNHGHGHGPHAGPYGFPGHHGPFGFGPRGHRGGRHGHGRHGGLSGGPFDFLRQFGAGLGFPMNGPADHADFTPSVDVFDTPSQYIVHASLPGAKKSDLSIDYDAEESVLHLAGVVYRPGVNEDLHQGLVMEERGREVGVFEREIRFGTRVAPAFVIVDEISAKLEDGVLNITLPKIVQDSQGSKKKVFVEGGDLNEKDAMDDERTLTPVESEGSDNEGEAREYVKVPVL